MEQNTTEQLMEFMKAQIGGLASDLAKMNVKMDADNCESKARQEEMMAEMKATIRSGQEETRAVIDSVRSELEETINTQTQAFVRSSMKHGSIYG
jgi:phage host-nuclease inhibitor protein Gam